MSVFVIHRQTFCSAVCVNDHKREPFPGVPFPSYGADTDRWFVFREWYFGSTCVAVRRLFLHSKISNAAEYLQAGVPCPAGGRSGSVPSAAWLLQHQRHARVNVAGDGYVLVLVNMGKWWQRPLFSFRVTLSSYCVPRKMKKVLTVVAGEVGSCRGLSALPHRWPLDHVFHY